MKKYLLLLLMLVSTMYTYAQRDTHHYIAPYFSEAGNYSNALYFSTDSLTPFDVQVFVGNSTVSAGTVTISKGNPQIYYLTATDISSVNDASAFVPLDNMGVRTVGSKPYLVTLRMYQSAHGEILTSKGMAGLGTEFYAVMPPLVGIGSSASYNFTVGLYATEDNTQITVSGYDPGVTFINGPTPTPATLTITLNKGQSYLLTGNGANLSNHSGFIGAKIVSTKPISMTNGNANGNFGNTSSGSDLILDQNVPVNRLGTDFGIIRSRTPVPDTQNMEGGIVVATENGTAIYVNGSTTPLATINAGQWYRIDTSNYQMQAVDIYNMYVKTSKNAYLYQILGVGATNTGGYNYIPPLNCYLPNTIDEVGLIDDMPNSTFTNQLKLNIITEAGGAVTVNGIAPNPAQGPYPLPGNAAWETYTIENITGNVTINSTKAVTAGINGGYSSAGYGGYFAGFAGKPLISKVTGECVPGIVLAVTSGYQTYQWKKNGINIPGATTFTYTPTSSGIYTCVVKTGTCAQVETDTFIVLNCTFLTNKYDAPCGDLEITPAFTPANSTQAVNPNTVKIITPPTNGIATVDPVTGKIKYVRNPGFTGTDVFVYEFKGVDPVLPDTERVTQTVGPPSTPPVTNTTLKGCFYKEDPTKGVFNLSTAPVSPNPTDIKKYYPTLADAQNGTNQIANFTNYVSAPTTVYVQVTSTSNCTSMSTIKLEIIKQKFSAVLVDKTICFEGRTNLDAGPGYTAYQWSTGATTQTILGVGVGEYWVDLHHEGCVTRQTVRVHKAAAPVVTNVEVSNNTVTLTVTGGTPPYKYSKDGNNWQDSNVFSGLPRGENMFYVKDAANCLPVSIQVTVPNFVNAITPNGDNINDYVDYNELAYKDNLVFSVYDRYGKLIHRSDKTSRYIWDGRFQGKKINTGTYWYTATWNEPNAEKTPVIYSGWIVVKNQ